MNCFDNMTWVTMFSRTGQEIADLCREIGRTPNIIISTKSSDVWAPDLKKIISESKPMPHLWIIDKQNAKDEYILRELLDNDPYKPQIVTTHGWLYIIPPEICTAFNIYNGHPGDIVKYDELKGIDPQQRAFNLQLETSGSVVHRTVAEVDNGEVLERVVCDIKNMDIDQTYEELRKTSLKAWTQFFNRAEEYM